MGEAPAANLTCYLRRRPLGNTAHCTGRAAGSCYQNVLEQKGRLDGLTVLDGDEDCVLVVSGDSLAKQRRDCIPRRWRRAPV